MKLNEYENYIKRNVIRKKKGKTKKPTRKGNGNNDVDKKWGKWLKRKINKKRKSNCN